MDNKLNVGCGTHYINGWTNTDVWQDDKHTPDILLKANEPYPFDDNSIDCIYLGHVLEHIPWLEVAIFLNDMQRIAKPEAPILIAGPDLYRTIKLWREGQLPWDLVESVMEHQDIDASINRLESNTDYWENAAHHWNCHEARLLEITKRIFPNATAISNDITSSPWLDPITGIEWPVVGYSPWQCAVRCTA